MPISGVFPALLRPHCGAKKPERLVICGMSLSEYPENCCRVQRTTENSFSIENFIVQNYLFNHNCLRVYVINVSFLDMQLFEENYYF